MLGANLLKFLIVGYYDMQLYCKCQHPRSKDRISTMTSICSTYPNLISRSLDSEPYGLIKNSKYIVQIFLKIPYTRLEYIVPCLGR